MTPPVTVDAILSQPTRTKVQRGTSAPRQSNEQGTRVTCRKLTWSTGGLSNNGHQGISENHSMTGVVMMLVFRTPGVILRWFIAGIPGMTLGSIVMMLPVVVIISVWQSLYTDTMPVDIFRAQIAGDA